MGANQCKAFRARNPKINQKDAVETGTPEAYDYIEDVVCKEEDINENEMKLLPLGGEGKKILLVKQKGIIHAIGTKCTHYGAMLHTGALGDGRIRCPWHGACFNIKTGDIEDFPGFDSLPCHKVTIDKGGLVHVKANRKDLEINKRFKPLCPLDPSNLNVVVIVGGGPAGAMCAQSLRQEGFSGHIIMICKEHVLPYDRVKVTKAMDSSIETLLLKPQLFYDESNIETKLGFEAVAVSPSEKTVKVRNLTADKKGHFPEEIVKYNYLFICTGSKPRVPEVPGANLKNVFVLRNYTDAQAVSSQLSLKKHLVVLGQSFIGMEAAAYCVDKCASVTIIGRDSIPLQRSFGAELGNRIKEEFENKGVKFIFGNNIAKFIPNENQADTLGGVELLDQSILNADIAIIGIGSTLCTEWLTNSSINMLEDGSIPVNEYLRTNIADVYAGGDIVRAPLFGSEDICTTIGHFPLAHYHGKVAALNICGKQSPLNAVPFFWTTLFGKSYRYAGYGTPNKIKIHGCVNKLETFAYHINNGQVIAMTSVGADPVVADFANLLYEGKWLNEEDIENNPFGWMRNKPADVTKRFQSVPCDDTRL